MGAEHLKQFQFRKGGTATDAGRNGGMSTSKRAQRLAQQIVEDPEYRRKLLERARTGKLAPAVEVALMAYAWGKPKESSDAEVRDLSAVLTEMPTEDLMARHHALASRLSELRQLVASKAEQEEQAAAQRDVLGIARTEGVH
jgi:hypothetical protein